MGAIARRGLLELPAKLLALFALRLPKAAAADPSVRLNEFMALSERLTARSGLDPGVGRLYLAGLLSDPKKGSRLNALVHGRAADEELEREIILNWYTGVYQSGTEKRVATHSGALLWKALGFPAAGTCKGNTGSWSQPPAGNS